MGSLGWHNPCPFEVGGGVTLVQRTYEALRSNVGFGGSAENDETIEGVWRQARATGIAAAASTGERALINAFPGHATDLLEYWETLVGAEPEFDDSLAQRRREAERLYTQRVDATGPGIDADLKRIDPRLGVVTIPREQATETLHGRAFEDLAALEPFGGGRKSTQAANYSTGFVVYVGFDLGDGATPSPEDQLVLADAARHLNLVLPAHVTFQISTSFGFTLDLDLLDLTGLVP